MKIDLILSFIIIFLSLNGAFGTAAETCNSFYHAKISNVLAFNRQKKQPVAPPFYELDAEASVDIRYASYLVDTIKQNPQAKYLTQNKSWLIHSGYSTLKSNFRYLQGQPTAISNERLAELQIKISELDNVLMATEFFKAIESLGHTLVPLPSETMKNQLPIDPFLGVSRYNNGHLKRVPWLRLKNTLDKINSGLEEVKQKYSNLKFDLDDLAADIEVFYVEISSDEFKQEQQQYLVSWLPETREAAEEVKRAIIRFESLRAYLFPKKGRGLRVI